MTPHRLFPILLVAVEELPWCEACQRLNSSGCCGSDAVATLCSVAPAPPVARHSRCGVVAGGSEECPRG